MCYHQIIIDAFRQAFDLTPFSWQVSLIKHLLKMWNNNCALPRSTVFLSQPTGGGKSMCRDAYSAIIGGLTWSFSPLLPLQTDQVSKLNNFVNALLIAINLDKYKGSRNRISKIATVLSSVTFKTPTSYIIFCLPQLITSSEVVMNMFRDHLKKKILNLVVVDEAHLIVQFGL